ncbi:hypothetical protein BC629DRAFT_1600857 [Irpex lacteus]|nr:hypothetical protein BC629DRAFT_1600857 [Irpex lacteus]
MEADPNPTNSTETDEVEFLGREIEYLGRSKRTNKQNDEDDEIEYMGYSIPALMPAGEYWVKAKYGGWERWDMPEPTEEERANPPRLRFRSSMVPETAVERKERETRENRRSRSERDEEDLPSSSSGPIFYFPHADEARETGDRGDRGSTEPEEPAWLPPGTETGPPCDVHRASKASASTSTTSDRPHKSVPTTGCSRSNLVRACSPARTAVRTTGASNDRRLSDAEILARLPPGSKLGPPRGARRANNASMLAKAAMDPDHNITPHSKSPLSNAYGEGQLTDVSAKSRRDARHANMSIASSTSFSPGENIGLQRGSHRVHEHSLPEPCHDHGEMNTESADSGAKTSHHKARRSTKPYDRATRSRGYSAS